MKILFKHTLFYGVAILIFNFLTVNGQHYQFVKEREFSGYASQYSFVSDLDNNAYSEVIIVSKGGSANDWNIQVEDEENHLILHLEPVWGRILDVKAFDFDDDGKKEIIYSYDKQDTLYIKIYEPYEKGKILLNEKIYTVKRRFKNRPWDGSVYLASFTDINHDGYSDIIMILQAFYDRYPRGIMVYDFHNRRILWETLIPTSIHWVHVKDINRDGKWEIYMDSGAPGNGTRINGMDDFHSYFIILDETGKFLFKKKMGGEMSGTFPLFVYNEHLDREFLYTATFTSNMQEYRNDRFIKWNWKIWPHLYKETVNENMRFKNEPAVLPYYGIPHIFVANSEGQLCLLDTTLRLVKIFPFKEKFSYFLGSFDLNGDGKKEYVWRSTGEQALVLNDRFKIIARIPSTSFIFEVERGRGRPTALAMLSNNGKFIQFRLKAVSPLILLLSHRWVLLGLGVVLFNILFWLLFTNQTGNWHGYRKQLQYFDSSLSAVFSLDNKGRITACNNTAESITGLPRSQLLNQPIEVIFTDYLSEVGEWIQAAFQYKISRYRRFLLKTEENERVWEVYMEFMRSMLGLNGGAIVTINDVTAHIHSQRTAAWLTVAQKLAHEIKNPLTTIRLTLQRLRYEYETDPTLKEKVGEFIEGSLEDINRMRKVLDDFMHFSRLDHAQFYQLNLAEIVRKVVERYQTNLPQGVTIKTSIDETLPFVQADGAQIGTLLTNLLDNAIHAIRPPGEIEIWVRAIEKINPDKGKYLEEMVELEISDTGEGMDEETLQKVFQPFFTTREGGSGLGMSIVKRIVSDHHGTIEVFSRKGLGTRVVIQFPVDTGEEEKS